MVLLCVHVLFLIVKEAPRAGAEAMQASHHAIRAADHAVPLWMYKKQTKSHLFIVKQRSPLYVPRYSHRANGGNDGEASIATPYTMEAIGQKTGAHKTLLIVAAFCKANLNSRTIFAVFLSHKIIPSFV